MVLSLAIVPVNKPSKDKNLDKIIPHTRLTPIQLNQILKTGQYSKLAIWHNAIQLSIQGKLSPIQINLMHSTSLVKLEIE